MCRASQQGSTCRSTVCLLDLWPRHLLSPQLYRDASSFSVVLRWRLPPPARPRLVQQTSSTVVCTGRLIVGHASGYPFYVLCGDLVVVYRSPGRPLRPRHSSVMGHSNEFVNHAPSGSGLNHVLLLAPKCRERKGKRALHCEPSHHRAHCQTLQRAPTHELTDTNQNVQLHASVEDHNTAHHC